MPARPFNDKYAQIALGLRERIARKVDRFELAPTLWKLADYLESQDDGKKHEQHLIQLGVKWVKALETAPTRS